MQLAPWSNLGNVVPTTLQNINTESRRFIWGSLTFGCTLFSLWTLSNVYFSERFWRILKSREPRFEGRDSSSSMMSLGTLTFFPRSTSASEHIHDIYIHKQTSRCLIFSSFKHKFYSQKKISAQFLLTLSSCQHDR